MPAENPVMRHLGDVLAVRRAHPGQRRGENVHRRVNADQRDPFFREVVRVNTLQRAVPPLEDLVEKRRDAHRRMQGDVASQRGRASPRPLMNKSTGV